MPRVGCKGMACPSRHVSRPKAIYRPAIKASVPNTACRVVDLTLDATNTPAMAPTTIHGAQARRIAQSTAPLR